MNYCNPGQKPVVGEVTGPSGEATAVDLLMNPETAISMLIFTSVDCAVNLGR